MRFFLIWFNQLANFLEWVDGINLMDDRLIDKIDTFK